MTSPVVLFIISVHLRGLYGPTSSSALLIIMLLQVMHNFLLLLIATVSETNDNEKGRVYQERINRKLFFASLIIIVEFFITLS
jgi:hypothetical protein